MTRAMARHMPRRAPPCPAVPRHATPEYARIRHHAAPSAPARSASTPAPTPAAPAHPRRALPWCQARAFREKVAALRSQHAPLFVRNSGGDFPIQLTGELVR